MAPHEPQPYAELKLDPYLWHIKSPVQKMHVGDVAFDRERGVLYLVEPFADGDQPIIHVFAIRGSAQAAGGTPAPVQVTTSPAPSGPVSTGTVRTEEAPADRSGGIKATQAPGYGVGMAVAGIIIFVLQKRMGR
jgi:hypothetical protein